MAGIAGQPMARARGTILNAIPAGTPTNGSADETSNDDALSGVGLDWLAALGAAAIGVLGGFVFGARKPKPPDGPAGEPEPQALPAVVPVVGWTAETPKLPEVTGGSVRPDGPSIAIEATTEFDPAERVDSLPILPEATADG